MGNVGNVSIVDKMDDFRIVDVAGSRDRNVAGTGHFEETVSSLPIGQPLSATLAHVPNETNPHAVAVFVDGRQVGWIGTTWSADAPELLFVKYLEAARITPRLTGRCELRTSQNLRYVLFYMPHDDELEAVTDELLREGFQP
jgi:hypothetical protein